MSFTAKDVAKLRGMTGAGMLDCKKALEETGGNVDEAVSFLRKKGIANAAKKADKVAAEGLVAALVADDKKSAVMVEVNSQTDFVAKNDQFKEFVAKVAKTALTAKAKTIDELLKAELEGKSVADSAVEQTATIGEKIDVRRVQYVESTGTVGAYVHPVGNKIATLVAISADEQEKANDIAMHVAAAVPAPEFVTRDEIPAATIENEKKIESEKEDLKGKPAEIIDKIVTGRVDKLLAAKVLVEQAFIKDPNQKVQAYLGADVAVESFTRFNLGEGVEKKEDNFAEEVAAMAAGK